MSLIFVGCVELTDIKRFLKGSSVRLSAVECYVILAFITEAGSDVAYHKWLMFVKDMGLSHELRLVRAKLIRQMPDVSQFRILESRSQTLYVGLILSRIIPWISFTACNTFRFVKHFSLFGEKLISR